MSDRQPEKTFQIWDSDEIRAIKEAAPIATEGAFTADDMVEIDRFLTACYMVMKPPGQQEHPSQVRAQLTGLKNGSGCWLDFVGRAILKAKVSDEDRLMVYGAYSMACAFLFDIQGHNRPDAADGETGFGERSPATR